MPLPPQRSAQSASVSLRLRRRCRSPRSRASRDATGSRDASAVEARRRRWVCWWHRGRRRCGWRWVQGADRNTQRHRCRAEFVVKTIDPFTQVDGGRREQQESMVSRGRAGGASRRRTLVLRDDLAGDAIDAGLRQYHRGRGRGIGAGGRMRPDRADVLQPTRKGYDEPARSDRTPRE